MNIYIQTLWLYTYFQKSKIYHFEMCFEICHFRKYGDQTFTHHRYLNSKHNFWKLLKWYKSRMHTSENEHFWWSMHDRHKSEMTSFKVYYWKSFCEDEMYNVHIIHVYFTIKQSLDGWNLCLLISLLFFLDQSKNKKISISYQVNTNNLWIYSKWSNNS